MEWCWWSPLPSTPAGEPTQRTRAPCTNECAHPHRTCPPQPSPCPPPPPPPGAGPVHMQPHRQPPSRDSFQKQNLLNYKWPASASIMNQIKDPLEESSGQLLGGARRNYSRLPLPLSLSLKDPTSCEGAHLCRTCQASDVGPTEPRLFVFPC